MRARATVRCAPRYQARAHQPRGEQALTAAEIQDAGIVGNQAVRETMAEERIVTQFGVREVPREAAGGAVRQARRIDQGERNHASFLAEGQIADGRQRAV